MEGWNVPGLLLLFIADRIPGYNLQARHGGSVIHNLFSIIRVRAIPGCEPKRKSRGPCLPIIQRGAVRPGIA
jgi:hypothetical protein